MTYFEMSSQQQKKNTGGGVPSSTPMTTTVQNNDRLGNALMRCGILTTGLFLGLITLMPNVMMSDSGTPKALRAAKIGMTASSLFAIGGVAGCIVNSWWCLLPGLIMQIVMFIYVG